MTPTPSERHLIDEDARRRFERAWLNRKPLAIDECLPMSSDPRWLATLKELVCVALELALTAPGGRLAPATASNANADGPATIESYVRKYPALGEPEILNELIGHEIDVRHRIGDP